MILEEDIKTIADIIYDYNYKNNKILITGSTGLIGSILAKSFLFANKKYSLNNKIFGLARNIEKAKIIFNEYLNDNLFEIVENEIEFPIEIKNDIDYIFHTACVTTSKEMITKPVELIKASVIGTLNILNFAKEHNTKSVIYLSSMEVYGVVEKNDKKLTENELGKLDLTSVRSCYPESKRMNENLCKCYSEEYGVNVCIARLTQTFGAGASINDNRIFAYIAKCVINGEDIVLKSSGKSTHDYCYTTDAISAILLLAKKGVAGETYNIANEKTNASILNMAKLVANNFNKNIKIKVEKTDNEMYSKDSIIKLNTTKMKKLGWKPKVNLIQMYDRLIKSFKEVLKKGEN